MLHDHESHTAPVDVLHCQNKHHEILLGLLLLLALGTFLHANLGPDRSTCRCASDSRHFADVAATHMRGQPTTQDGSCGSACGVPLFAGNARTRTQRGAASGTGHGCECIAATGAHLVSQHRAERGPRCRTGSTVRRRMRRGRTGRQRHHRDYPCRCDSFHVVFSLRYASAVLNGFHFTGKHRSSEYSASSP